MPPLPFTPLGAGNSPEAVVAFLVNERNYLRQQNAQLWKIIEKQVTSYNGWAQGIFLNHRHKSTPQTPPTTTDAAQHADPSPVNYSFIQSGRDESNIKSDEPDTEPTYEPPPPERRASLMSRAGSTFSLSHKHLPSRSSSILSLENNPILNRFKDAGVVITATAATTRNSSRSTTPHTLSGIDQIPGLPSKGRLPPQQEEAHAQ
ncbi:hypothetical protein BCR33DRAFT_786568 [Rhizoclosmatium globosum]|uniref:Uncharacterized protein n=1 Tax=Rhizoclosmatium globosum TaxID=329046 RepID=A0A1Y2C673_9FUNG|nr:hypothetical protein BCR33DRAFT_786568 [Rhizoclosmatium globosum]|eukprot:ORY42377.1 hypothetical protein BCR33DRAFT_786568 [Rhizoclosmatium globosum]